MHVGLPHVDLVDEWSIIMLSLEKESRMK